MHLGVFDPTWVCLQPSTQVLAPPMSTSLPTADSVAPHGLLGAVVTAPTSGDSGFQVPCPSATWDSRALTPAPPLPSSPHTQGPVCFWGVLIPPQPSPIQAPSGLRLWPGCGQCCVCTLAGGRTAPTSRRWSSACGPITTAWRARPRDPRSAHRGPRLCVPEPGAWRRDPSLALVLCARGRGRGGLVLGRGRGWGPRLNTLQLE